MASPTPPDTFTISNIYRHGSSNALTQPTSYSTLSAISTSAVGLRLNFTKPNSNDINATIDKYFIEYESVGDSLNGVRLNQTVNPEFFQSGTTVNYDFTNDLKCGTNINLELRQETFRRSS